MSAAARRPPRSTFLIGPYLPADAMGEFKRLSAHGAGFIGSIDTYLVQSHTVVEHPSDGGYWL